MKLLKPKSDAKEGKPITLPAPSRSIPIVMFDPMFTASKLLSKMISFGEERISIM